MGGPERPGVDRPWRVLFVDAEPVWRDALPAGLAELGHEVAVVSRLAPGVLPQAIAAHRPDFALTVGWGTLHGPDNLALLRADLARARLPHVYWDVESVNNLERWVLPYLARTRPDLVCTISAESIPAIEATGVPARWLTFGCNPRIHRPVPPVAEWACDFALVATAWDAWRDDRGECLRQLLAPLLDGPGRVGVWGRRWEALPPEAGFQVPAPLLHGPVPHDQAAEVYASAAAVLGPQNERRSGTQLTMRTFEILGCGAPLLTWRTPAVTRLFVPGQHLLASRSAAETLAHARWLLEHPDRRAALGQEGRREVLARHTYRHRAAELCDHVAEALPAFGGTPWPPRRRQAWYGEFAVTGGGGGTLPVDLAVPLDGLPPDLEVQRATLCLLGARGEWPMVVHCLHDGRTVGVVGRPDGLPGRWCEWDVAGVVTDALRAGHRAVHLRITAEPGHDPPPVVRGQGWTTPPAARPHLWVTGLRGGGDARPDQGAGRPHAAQ